tara:strand:- start:862 stop:4434 length:3573 start_codon:yes stop_codon:yes gene_type:complete
VNKLGGRGEIGTIKNRSVPQLGPKFFDFRVKPGEFFILIHSSNFHYRGGGLISGMELGLKENLKKSFDNKKIQKFFTLGIFLIMSLYHFGLFVQRREDKGSLWFGVFCMIVVLRFLSNDSYIDGAFNKGNLFSFYLNRKIEFLTFYLGGPVFFEFLKFLFPDYFKKIVMRSLWGISAIFGAIVVLLPPFLFSKTLPFYQLFVLLFFLILIFQMTRAVFKQTPYSKICLIGIGVFIFGTIWDILIASQVITAPEIAAFTSIAFVFIQSYILSQKFSYAYETAERLSRHLEKEVEIRTKEAVEARNEAIESERKVSNLLNNMGQSVFTVDSKGVILGPVSFYSNLIFDGPIEGKNIFDILYKDLDKKSELYSTMLFAFNTIFDADSLQWELMLENFPQKINLSIRNGDVVEVKILSCKLYPLWNEAELLERMMFVVEDITQLEKLGKEIEDQKKSSLKNIQRLQELAKNSKEDLVTFFQVSSKMISDSLNLSKIIRTKNNDHESLEDAQKMLRILHTLKGNARVCNLTGISSITHEVEGLIQDTIVKEGLKKPIDLIEMNVIVQKLYELQGELSRYVKSAQEVFNLEFQDDLRFKEKIHELMKSLEMIIGKSYFQKDKVDKFLINDKIIVEKIYQESRPSYFDDLYEKEMLAVLHSMKGLARGIDERDLSGQIHLLENGVNYYKKETVLNISSFKEEFLDPLSKIRQYTLSILTESDYFKPLPLNEENWSNSIVQLSKLMNDFNRYDNYKDINHLVYGVYTQFSSLKLEYIPMIFRLFFNALESDAGLPKSSIDYFFKQIWIFTFFILQFDAGYKLSVLDRDLLIKFLEGEASIETLKEKIYNTIIFKTLENYLSRGKEIESFFNPLMELFKCSKKDIINSLVSRVDLKQYNKDLRYSFSRELAGYNIKDIKINKNKEETKFLDQMNLLFEERDFTWVHYLKRYDVMRTLEKYSSEKGDHKKEHRPDMKEVLIENTIQFKKDLIDIVGNKNIITDERFETIFNKLFELPVKYSFNKFKGLVQEVSQTLGKKVNFQLGGVEGSLSKEKLQTLHEAIIHLIRNSLDHGIERPEIRLNKGKDEEGKIEINCYKGRNGELVIKIKDDGQGIDIKRLVEKAKSSNILSDEDIDNMTEKEKIDLIFLPNLSTKEKVSEISGRGVGMDAVKKILKEIKGDISIENDLGQGTAFIITIAS